MTKRTKALMSHDERRALIDKPFPIVTMPGRTWGGSMPVNDTDPAGRTSNRRIVDAEFRSWFRNHAHIEGGE